MATKPQTVELDVQVDPYQGFARMAASIIPPKGYHFKSMTRKGVNAKVTFELDGE